MRRQESSFVSSEISVSGYRAVRSLCPNSFQLREQHPEQTPELVKKNRLDNKSRLEMTSHPKWNSSNCFSLFLSGPRYYGAVCFPLPHTHHVFSGLMVQSPHDLTAASPSDAQAAVSSCFLCHTHTSVSTTRGAGRGSGTSVSLLLVAAQLFSCPERQEQRGQDACWAPPSLPGQHLFLQDRFQQCTSDFRWNFAALFPFWQLGSLYPPSVRATANCPESLKRDCW